MFRIEYPERIYGQNGHEIFKESLVVGKGIHIQVQVVAQEIVGGHPLGVPVIVFFRRQVHIFHPVLRIIEGIHALDIGIFDPRGVPGPVGPVRDQQHGPRGSQGGDLYIVGLVMRAPVDGHPALADASPEKMGRNLHHGNRNPDPFIQGRQHEGLGTAPRLPGHPDPFRVHIGP